MLAFRPIPLLLLLAVLCVALGPRAAVAQPGGESFIIGSPRPPGSPDLIPPRVLVRFQPAAGERSIAGDAAVAGALSVRDLGGGGLRALEFPPGTDVQRKAAELRQRPGVVDAEPEIIRRLSFHPNDPCYRGVAPVPNTSPLVYVCQDTGKGVLLGPQWNLERIQLSPAWDVSTGAGTVVAVLDTGYRPGTDSAVNLLVGFNALTGTNATDDDYGHGTHVANTIVARTNNGLGTAGVAFDASLMPIKVCDGSGNCPTSAIIAGINFARQNGARIISLSLGSAEFSPLESQAIAQAIADNVVVVAAAGNSGVQPVQYPAGYPNVIGVGATRWDNSRVGYSNFGTGLFVMAPGGDPTIDQNQDGLNDAIFAQVPGYGCGQAAEYVFCGMTGTSMATPHVTGVIALLLSASPQLNVGSVRAILQASSLDLGQPGYDGNYGWGLVQAHNALQQIGSCPAPSGFTAPPTTGTLVYMPAVFRTCQIR